MIYRLVCFWVVGIFAWVGGFTAPCSAGFIEVDGSKRIDPCADVSRLISSREYFTVITPAYSLEQGLKLFQADVQKALAITNAYFSKYPKLNSINDLPVLTRDTNELHADFLGLEDYMHDWINNNRQSTPESEYQKVKKTVTSFRRFLGEQKAALTDALRWRKAILAHNNGVLERHFFGASEYKARTEPLEKIVRILGQHESVFRDFEKELGFPRHAELRDLEGLFGQSLREKHSAETFVHDAQFLMNAKWNADQLPRFVKANADMLWAKLDSEIYGTCDFIYGLTLRAGFGNSYKSSKDFLTKLRSELTKINSAADGSYLPHVAQLQFPETKALLLSVALQNNLLFEQVDQWLWPVNGFELGGWKNLLTTEAQDKDLETKKTIFGDVSARFFEFYSVALIFSRLDTMLPGRAHLSTSAALEGYQVGDVGDDIVRSDIPFLHSVALALKNNEVDLETDDSPATLQNYSPETRALAALALLKIRNRQIANRGWSNSSKKLAEWERQSTSLFIGFHNRAVKTYGAEKALGLLFSPALAFDLDVTGLVTESIRRDEILYYTQDLLIKNRRQWYANGQREKVVVAEYSPFQIGLLAGTVIESQLTDRPLSPELFDGSVWDWVLGQDRSDFLNYLGWAQSTYLSVTNH